MKKILAWVMAALMVCSMLAALAEEGQIAPLYATVGEALEDCDEYRRVAGGVPGEYYAVVTQKDGTYYRSVAYVDEKLNELNEALDSLDYEAEDFFEKYDAASEAVDEYIKTLPIAYSEAFTAQPLTEEEMASMQGKKLSELTEAGFEIGSNGTENDENEEVIIVYSLRYGVYDYSCLMDCDIDQYFDAKDQNAEGDLVLKNMTLAGVTEWGFDLRFHADGTVEEPEDPFAELNDIVTEIVQLLEKAQSGEEIDFNAFADTLKEEHPDFAEMIDMYVMLYQTYGLEDFAALMTPAE